MGHITDSWGATVRGRGPAHWYHSWYYFIDLKPLKQYSWRRGKKRTSAIRGVS
jgi:hypothetical protein